MLIDCHVHINNYDEARSRSADDIAADLFASMDENGVDHAVVLTSYKVNAHRPHVDEVIRVVGGDPRITIVEGLRWRDPDERTDLYNLEDRIRDGFVKGIKLYPGYDRYPINDPSLESVFRVAEKHDVPVMIHCGDTYSKHAKVRQAHPLLVDDIAVDYPEVRFVICHLGNPWFQDAAEVLYKNDNVYADISGLTLGEFHYEFERYMLQRVRDMISYMGDPGKQLMYGTDWPLAGMRTYRRFFDSLQLSAEAKEGIAWRTAAKLFRIDVAALEARRAARPACAGIDGGGADA